MRLGNTGKTAPGSRKRSVFDSEKKILVCHINTAVNFWSNVFS